MTEKFFSKFKTKTIVILAVLLLLSPTAFASVPQIVGLGGGGTAGVPKDALFSNPAAVGGLTTHRAFYSYSQSKIRDLGAGGRVWATGVYDGKSKTAKGGLSYIRESRRRLVGGGSPYLDTQTVRGVIGRSVWKNLMTGVTVNYKMIRENEDTSTNIFSFDAGVIYPIWKGMPLGLKVENTTDQDNERPRNAMIGLKYRLSGPLALVGDYGRTVSSKIDTRNSWAIAAEVFLFNELVLRGALFRDGIDEIRGTSLGISWFGPRTAFEYALRLTNGSPRERDHVLGVSLEF